MKVALGQQGTNRSGRASRLLPVQSLSDQVIVEIERKKISNWLRVTDTISVEYQMEYGEFQQDRGWISRPVHEGIDANPL